MSSSRTDHTQLPGSDEISEIVAAEAKRRHDPSKLNKRLVDFSTIIRLYDYYDIDSSFFADKGQKAEEILEIGAKVNQELIDKILQQPPTSAAKKLFEAAYEYLSEEDELSKVDFIFAFGNKTIFRAQKAIELYKKGLAEKIIFAGHVPHYADKTATPEAEQYKELAIKDGVAESSIITEPESITIPDNIRRSLNMLDEQNIHYSSFILVNSPYSQRRGWCVFNKYVPDDCKILRANCATNAEYSKTNWFKNQNGLSVVLGEFIKLHNAVTFNDA